MPTYEIDTPRGIFSIDSDNDIGPDVLHSQVSTYLKSLDAPKAAPEDRFHELSQRNLLAGGNPLNDDEKKEYAKLGSQIMKSDTSGTFSGINAINLGPQEIQDKFGNPVLQAYQGIEGGDLNPGVKEAVEKLESPIVSPEFFQGFFDSAKTGGDPLSFSINMAQRAFPEQAKGIEESVSNTVSGLTSPLNLGMMAAGGAETQIIGRGLAALFAVEGAKSIKPTYDAFQAETDPQKKAKLGADLVTAGMITLGAGIGAAHGATPSKLSKFKENIHEAPMEILKDASKDEWLAQKNPELQRAVDEEIKFREEAKPIEPGNLAQSVNYELARQDYINELQKKADAVRAQSKALEESGNPASAEAVKEVKAEVPENIEAPQQLKDRGIDEIRQKEIDFQNQEVAPEGLSERTVSEPVTEPAKVEEVAQQIEGEPPPITTGLSDGPGAAHISELGLKKVVSIKNEKVNERRAQEGNMQLLDEVRKSNEETWNQSEKLIEQDPDLGSRLVDELRDGVKKSVTDEEVGVLLHEAVSAKNARDIWAERAADENLGSSEREFARKEWEKAESRLNEVDQATKAAGTSSARALQFRKVMLSDDYTYAGMERKARASKGEPLTLEESKAIELEADQHQKITQREAELESALELQRQKNAAIVAQNKLLRELGREPKTAKPRETIPRDYQPRKPLGEKAIKYLDTQAQEALKRIREKLLSTAGSGVDVSLVGDAAIYGAAKLGKAAIKFTQWGLEMKAELGEWIEPHLRDIWKSAKELADSANTKVERDIPAERAATIEGIKAAQESKNTGKVGSYAQTLAKQFIEEGITELEPLSAAVHGAMKEAIPSITPEQSLHAWTGYGKFKPLDSSDPVKVRLSEAKTEGQKLATIQRYQQKLAGLKTGAERRPLTDKARALEKEGKKLAKDLGIEVTSPERQLKSSLDSVKSRLQNEIADLDFAINTGKRVVRDKSGVIYDAEAQALKAQRDAKKAEYDSIFPEEPITPEEQIKRATKAAVRNQAAWEARLEDARKGKFSKKDTAASVTSDSIQEIKGQIETIKEEINLLKDLENPKKSDVEIALQARKSAAIRRIQELSRKRRESDFAPKEKKEITPKTPEELQLQRELDKVQFAKHQIEKKFNQELLKHKLSNRGGVQKAFEGTRDVLNAFRAIKTSFDLSAVLRQGGFISIGNPVRALRAFPDMLRALKSEAGQFKIDKEIHSRPNATLYEQAKLFLHDMNDIRLEKMEEAYMSRLGDKIPGVVHSQRAYTTFLNRLRADTFDALARPDMSIAELRAIADYINVSTGRGHLGTSANAAINLNSAFFSPKYVVSRFELLAGQPLWKGTARTRKIIAKEYAKFLTGIAAIYALGQAAGADVEVDPRSSDFGKMRFGDTTVDPLAGLAQATVLLGRTATGQTKTGKGVRSLNAEDVKFGQSDYADIFGKFLRTKVSPSVGTFLDVRSGKDVTGKPVSWKDIPEKMISPLIYSDIKKSLQENGVPAGTALSLLALLGMSVQNYERQQAQSGGTESRAISRPTPR